MALAARREACSPGLRRAAQRPAVFGDGGRGERNRETANRSIQSMHFYLSVVKVGRVPPQRVADARQRRHKEEQEQRGSLGTCPTP